GNVGDGCPFPLSLRLSTVGLFVKLGASKRP
ncbi:Hypothetical protein, partial CDS, partial [Neorhizobium galegae bv. officinalis]